MKLKFFNPWADIERWENRLPHWAQSGATYSVTFRVGDSLPREILAEWWEERKIWEELHPRPWSGSVELEYLKRFIGAREKWLDRGMGRCPLKAAVCRDALERVLMKFDGDRYFHHSWVAMPNHVHMLFSLGESGALDLLMKAWKGVSSREFGKLGFKGSGDERFWAKDYFDRMIRDWDHFWNYARYVRNNPVRAKLSEGEYALYESDFVREHLDGA